MKNSNNKWIMIFKIKSLSIYKYKEFNGGDSIKETELYIFFRIYCIYKKGCRVCLSLLYSID